jgi:hypothetical protein
MILRLDYQILQLAISKEQLHSLHLELHQQLMVGVSCRAETKAAGRAHVRVLE